MIVKLLLAVGLLATSVAWTDIPHCMVAEIAKRQLSEKQLDSIDGLSMSYSRFFHDDLLKLPYAATFMDYIKRDTSVFDPLHYVKTPYQISGDFPEPSIDSTSALSALHASGNALMFNGEHTLGWSKAFSLLALVHIVGDIHQPLHAVTLFSDKFVPPAGDMGGNLYEIVYVSEFGQQYTQLHLLYDCVGGLYCGSGSYMPLPITASFADVVVEEVDTLMKEFPIEAFSPAEVTPDISSPEAFKKVVDVWAAESFTLAVMSYNKVPFGGAVTPEQVRWMRDMLRRRVALAGYRLGWLLRSVNAHMVDPREDEVSPMWRSGCMVLASLVGLLACIIAYLQCKTRQHTQSEYRLSYININE